MKTLKIDGKWSVEYDPANNDKPVELRRYDERVPRGLHNWTNDVMAMFYALLETRQVRNETAEADRPLEPDFAAMTIDIHADIFRAGWWTDLKTQADMHHTRNRPELLMLAVTELAEAADGADGTMDDKLPHLPMYDVELADFVIRQFDQIGAEVACGHAMPSWDYDTPTFVDLNEVRAMSRSDRLMDLVGTVAGAMEHYRKERVSEYMQCMAYGVMRAFLIADVEDIKLLDIIEQKRAFNRTREDHQIANRIKDGGKKI